MKNRKYRIYGNILYYLLKIIFLTLDVRIMGAEDKIDGKKSYVCGMWHNKLLVILLCLKKLKKRAGLASPSKDGELISVPLERMGYRMVRGSSGKESVKSLVQIIKLVKNEGYSLGTPLDGPKGPVYEVKPGMIYAAQKSGKQLVLVGGAYSKKWIFSKTWDKFQLPKPFSKVVCIVGEPIDVPKDIDPKDYSEFIKEKLNELNDLAEKEILKIK